MVPPAHSIRVLICIDARGDWKGILQSCLSRQSSKQDVQFGVLITSAGVDDVTPVLGTLRDLVDIRFTPNSFSDPIKCIRRLIKRFVNGLESIVIVIDCRLTMEYGWDLMIPEMVKNDEILTCPAMNGRCGFPTLRRRSSGAIVRSEARPMKNESEFSTIPAVCLCHEFLAAHTTTLLEWYNGKTPKYAVPTCPILVSSNLEEKILDECDELPLSIELTDTNKVGLSEAPSTEEMYYKFGSVTSASMAIKVEKIKG